MLLKASLKSSAFAQLLKVRREGAWYTSTGNAFHSVAATTEKAKFLVVIFQASLGVTIYNYEAWIDQVAHLNQGSSIPSPQPVPVCGRGRTGP